MKKLKYSTLFYSQDYFSKNILPNSIYAGRKIIRQQIPYKQHDDLEILLIRRGAGTVTVNATEYPVGPGDLFCFSPYHFHKLEVAKGQKLEVSECRVNSGVYFYISACPYFNPSRPPELPSPRLHIKLDESHAMQAEKLIDEIGLECQKKNIQENQPCFFLLMKLFGIIEQYAAQQTGG